MERLHSAHCPLRWALSILCLLGLTTPCWATDMEAISVDIARRALLVKHPHLARLQIESRDVRVAPQGDITHSYVKLYWVDGSTRRRHEADIYMSFVDKPKMRRIFDIGYRDTYGLTYRNYEHLPELVSVVNEEFAREDTIAWAYPERLADNVDAGEGGLLFPLGREGPRPIIVRKLRWW